MSSTYYWDDDEDPSDGSLSGEEVRRRQLAAASQYSHMSPKATDDDGYNACFSDCTSEDDTA